MVDRAVGSMVGEGTISALSYAWRVISLGETLLVASLLTALYPAFGAAAGAWISMRCGAWSVVVCSTVATVLMPVWGFLIVSAVLLVALLFEHGSFTPADTQRTATAMLWYAPALLALGWREVVRASYALGDSRRPVLVFVFAMSINVVGDFTLGLTFGIAGPAASTSLSVVFAAVANTVMLGRRHGAVDLRSLPVMVVCTALRRRRHCRRRCGLPPARPCRWYGSDKRAVVGVLGRIDSGRGLHRRPVPAVSTGAAAARRSHRRGSAPATLT